jgi:hypothetical protein
MRIDCCCLFFSRLRSCSFENDTPVSVSGATARIDNACAFSECVHPISIDNDGADLLQPKCGVL